MLAQLKSAAMGEQLGQANASEATTRIIAPHSYRLCMSVGAQPAHTGVLFDDTTGGTPQRFLWFLTIDPDMPAEPAADPDPLDTELPLWRPGEDGVVEITYGPPEIAEQIIAAHIARQRGQAEALDGHAMLTRCKVAAVLAILHGRSVVSELDWQLSETVMAESARVRDWIVAESRKAARKKIRDRALAHAAGEEMVDERRLTTVRRRIVSVLSEGPIAGGKLRAALGRREYRELFDQAVMGLESEGVIYSDSSGRGTRFALDRGLNIEHPVQPTNPQVNRAEQGLNTEQSGHHSEVHAVPESPPESESQAVPHTPARPTQGTCPGCYVHMPLDPETGRCEECDDPAHRVPAKTTAPPLTVVHSGSHKEEDNYRIANTILNALTDPTPSRRATR